MSTAVFMNQRRTYTMRARAAAVENTRRRILDAAFALAGERLFTDIGLEAVARRADVSVQTVLRQFGSRAGLVEAAVEHGSRIVAAERQAPARDVAAALRVLVDHYERRGDAVVLLLAQASVDPVVARAVDSVRGLHRDWVAEVFGPLLGVDVADREEAFDVLVVVTDVHTWRLLRRDRGLSREAVEARMHRLATAVLAAVTGPGTQEPAGTGAP
jgi:AcrR family transcriptional regulator